MKNIYYLVFTVCLTIIVSAQNFSVYKLDGSAIDNGSTLTVTTTNYPDAKIGFKVKNISSGDITVFMQVVGMTNCDGTGMETCFGGSCVNSITLNQVIPSTGLTLAPNQTNTDFDYYFNTNPTSTNGEYPMTYVFQFYEQDQFGGVLGTPYMVNYVYDPENLGVEDISGVSNQNFVLNATIVNNEIKLVARNNASANVISQDGKVLQVWSISEGSNSLDISHLNTGVYFIQIQSEEGLEVKKVIKR